MIFAEFPMLTRCCPGEIASLDWEWIKNKHIRLPDTKSGPRTVWLSSAARAVIDAIPRCAPDCTYFLPARPPTRPIDNMDQLGFDDCLAMMPERGAEHRDRTDGC